MINLKQHFKKGDTLVEVTIAIGIFALVAISVVAVVSASTSGAQSALETTLTREEVDAQAEALRFISSAYYEDNKDNLDDCGTSTDSKHVYCKIWNEIIEKANEINGDDSQNPYNKNVESCNALYAPRKGGKNELEEQNAFILNLKALDEATQGGSVSGVDDIIKKIVIGAGDTDDNGQKILGPTSTYPQLEYDDKDQLKSARGIYIVGVKAKDDTTSVSRDEHDEAQVGTTSAYYDFYVHSCWYNSGSEVPSTVSTALRLRDPNAIAYEPQKSSDFSYKGGGVDPYEFDEWKRYGEKNYTHHLAYCGEGNPPVLTQSGTAYETTCEPLRDQHIEAVGNNITLIGSTDGAVNLGIYYDKFDLNSTFVLYAQVDSSNIASHPTDNPNDGLKISFDLVKKCIWGKEQKDDDTCSNYPNYSFDDPKKLEGNVYSNLNYITIKNTDEVIANHGIEAVFNDNQKKIIVYKKDGITEAPITDSKFDIELTYKKSGANRAVFEGCVTSARDSKKTCVSSNQQIDDGAKYLRVDFNSTSSEHGCSLISVIKLFDIEMSSSTRGNITF